VIGQGGEGKVWNANVVTEGARAHGRWGTGGVMGSKMLRALWFVAPRARSSPTRSLSSRS